MSEMKEQEKEKRRVEFASSSLLSGVRVMERCDGKKDVASC
jgi:hypothetical protein